MLNKSNLLGLCCFILGVGLTSGYFLFLHSMPIQAQQSQPFPYKSIVIKQANDESLNSTDEHVNPADGNSQAEILRHIRIKLPRLPMSLSLKPNNLNALNKR